MTDPNQNPQAPSPSQSALALRVDTPLSTHLAAAQHGPLEDDDAIDLRHYWEVILKRKGTVLAFFAIVVVAVAVGTLLMTPIYRASLTMQIERGEAKVVEIQQVTPTEAPGESRDFYQTQYELLKSRSLAQRVIDQLALAENPVFTQKHRSLLDYVGLGDDGDKDARRQNAGV